MTATIGTSTSVRAATIDLLRHRGMTTIFGNPGSTELGLLVDLPSDFRYVMALHESVAVAMADGYAQISGRAAFVNLHSACGVGNAMGAVANAYHNRAPLVITGGNQDRRHLALEPFLYARGVELMAPYVKRSEQPARSEDVPAAIDRAWALAQTRPYGPVFVSVPADDWDVSTTSRSATGGDVRAGTAPAGRDVDDLARRLSGGAVALVAGAGADRDGAWEALTALAERLDAAVWAAPQSPRLGFPEDHPLYRGHLAPGYASAAAQLSGFDVALVVGAPVFAFLPYAPSEQPMPAIVQITDDPDEAARAPSALSLIGDARAIIRALLDRIDRADAARHRAAAARVAAPPPPASTPISPAFLMATLAQVLPEDAVLVEESPSNRHDLRRYVWIRRPASFFACASGGLGFAMPAAVGIKLAQPERPVVCLVGDGSALYASQALWNAVQLGVPVTFIVVNNARYAILESVAAFGGLEGIPSLELPGIDFLAAAAAYGCPAVRVSDPEELGATLESAISGAEPVLVDVMIDREIPPLLPA